MENGANKKDSLNSMKTTIMQIDLQKNGPIPDDAKEAYERGIMAVLQMLDG